MNALDDKTMLFIHFLLNYLQKCGIWKYEKIMNQNIFKSHPPTPCKPFKSPLYYPQNFQIPPRIPPAPPTQYLWMQPKLSGGPFDILEGLEDLGEKYLQASKMVNPNFELPHL